MNADKIIKLLIVMTLGVSLALNIYQHRAINHQSLVNEHLFKYKLAFMKTMQILNVPSEQVQLFLNEIDKNQEK